MFTKLRDDEFGFPHDGIADYYHPRSWKWWHIILIILIVFPYIAIPILFVMVSNADSDTNNVRTKSFVFNAKLK
jgi:hypothetical protein